MYPRNTYSGGFRPIGDGSGGSGYRGIGRDGDRGYQEFGRDGDGGCRGFGRDGDGGYQGFGSDGVGGYRGFGRDGDGGYRGFGCDGDGGYRGFGCDGDGGYRGSDHDGGSGYRGSNRDGGGGYWDFSRDGDDGYRGSGRDGERGYRSLGRGGNRGYRGNGRFIGNRGSGGSRVFGQAREAAGHTESCSWRCTEKHTPVILVIPSSCDYPDGAAAEVMGSSLSPPRVLGWASINSDKSWTHDCSGLKFIDKQYIPKDGPLKVELDLISGWEHTKFNKVNFYDWNYQFYIWILKNIDLVKAHNISPVRLKADFVARKHSLEDIMSAPNDPHKRFLIDAHLIEGSIYLQHMTLLNPKTVSSKPRTTDPNNAPKDDNEDSRNNPDNNTDGSPAVALEKIDFITKLGIYGHKFYQYMTGGGPGEGVDQNQMFVCMLELHVAEFSVIFPIKVHCADPELFTEDFQELDAFIIIRSCKEVNNHHAHDQYQRFRLHKWWIEGQITGIPRTVVGFRDDAGMVNILENLPTNAIPDIAQGAWYPESSVNFLAEFLQFVRMKVEEKPEMHHCFVRESSWIIRHSASTKPCNPDALPENYAQDIKRCLRGAGGCKGGGDITK